MVCIVCSIDLKVVFDVVGCYGLVWSFACCSSGSLAHVLRWWGKLSVASRAICVREDVCHEDLFLLVASIEIQLESLCDWVPITSCTVSDFHINAKSCTMKALDILWLIVIGLINLWGEHTSLKHGLLFINYIVIWLIFSNESWSGCLSVCGQKYVKVRHRLQESIYSVDIESAQEKDKTQDDRVNSIEANVCLLFVQVMVW